MRPRPQSPRRFLAAATLLILSMGGAAAQDLFQPGERWHAQPAGTQSWMPSEVAFAARGSWLFSCADFGTRRFQLFDAHDSSFGAATPFAERILPSTATGSLDVAAARTGTALYALHQELFSAPLVRRTTVARLDPLAPDLAPMWTHDLTFLGNAKACLATDADGQRVYAAIWDGAFLRLTRYDGASGALLGELLLPGGSLVGLEAALDGSRVAVCTTTDVWVLDAALGPDLGVILQQALLSAPSAFAYSGDGRTLVLGFLGRAEIWRDDGAWHLAHQRSGAALDVALRAALADDGSLVALAWWNAANGIDQRWECLVGPSYVLTWQQTRNGANNGLQDLPQDVRVSGESARALFTSWGQGGNELEVVLVDVSIPDVVFSTNLQGSVRGADLDVTGTRIAVAHKDTHANLSGASGTVRLFDTGERDVQALRGARSGGRLTLAARRSVPVLGIGPALFMVGPRLDPPLLFPGTGLLQIDRAASRSFARQTDASGEARIDLPLASGAFSAGQTLTVQVVFRPPGGGAPRLSTRAVTFYLY